MIVEFIGLPGSGKTTVAKEISRITSKNGLLVEYPLYDLYGEKWIKRNIIKALTILKVIIRLPIKALMLIAIILSSKQKKFTDNFRLIFNNLYLLEKIRYYSKSKKIILFDEGVFHHCWAINIGAEKQVDIDRYLKVFRNCSRKVIYIYCEIDIIANTIHSRDSDNKRMLYIKDNLKDFSIKMEKIVGSVDENSLWSFDNSSRAFHEDTYNQIVKWISSECCGERI